MRLEDIIIWILFTAAIIVGLWYLFGNSPTFEQAILLFIIGALFAINSSTNKIGMELKFLRRHFGKLEESHVKLLNDFREYVRVKERRK